ncbi:winged helix DNA-binding protein [Novosphingobium sp. ZN18A2]|uniref:winged helix DNA-binding protein n=1 Tax=Novosphingobium sp. ZN18A2 TaxID=3079861 RepID=UPI0030D07FEF
MIRMQGNHTRTRLLPGAEGGPDGRLAQAEADSALRWAREIYTERRRRDRFFPTDLFGEPSWDILLDLFIASRESRRVPTTSACIGAHVPPTTALRWLRILESRGLVEREGDRSDGRRTFVRLSTQGLKIMEEFVLSTKTALLRGALGDTMDGGQADGAEAGQRGNGHANGHGSANGGSAKGAA